MCISLATRSVNLPFPSSPHWVPTTTVAGTLPDANRGEIQPVRAVVQRVGWARVRVGGEVVGRIGAGLLVLLGVTHTDTEAEANKMAAKLWGLRIFDAGEAAMGAPVAEVGGDVLVVSQFTVYGDTTRGRRPSWSAAAPSHHAEPMVEAVVAALEAHGATVATGRFDTHMSVELVNDGPVTLVVEV